MKENVYQTSYNVHTRHEGRNRVRRRTVDSEKIGLMWTAGRHYGLSIRMYFFSVAHNEGREIF
jgi:hypothetical protein